MPGTIAVLTMSKGRPEELLRQVDGLSVGSVPPDLHVVVSMGDRDLTRGRLPLGTDRWTTVVCPVPTDRRALPLAAARNRAAREALEVGADVLIFLDGDVIPGSRTLERYADAVTGVSPALRDLARPDGPVVWAGPVLQLPEPPDEHVGYPLGHLHKYGVRTPGTPALSPGELRPETRWDYFHAVAFAMSPEDFRATGGFCEDYTGHGLEDADFAHVVHNAGGALVWVGGATAYVQPRADLDRTQETRIALRHAEVWRGRWGAEPAHPWLQRLRGEGLLRLDEGRWGAA
ncbi:galactosyltransferase-related protein [Ornithinimicrobium sp. LYQ121]|uniref:glycosyltransferase family 2 protein n=1 Tax=Ornithinimicrobium sp. LYQ121 TaxID=3378801 RepID=UPI003855623D